MNGTARNPLMIPGAVVAVLGVLALLMPVTAAMAINVLLGLALLLAGLALGAGALALRGGGIGFWPLLLAAILAGLVGLLLLANPVEGAIALSLILVVFFGVKGVSAIFLAFDLRPRRGWVLALASGLVSLGLSLVIVVGWPATGAAVPGLLLGAYLTLHGLILIALGNQLRPAL